MTADPGTTALQVPSTAEERRWTSWLVVALGTALVLLVVVGLTYVYVSAERTLYTWDFHEYTTRLEETYRDLRSSPLTALVEVYLSTSQEYNLIPTIPLLPLRAILGDSRLAYELNAALVFIVPFVLITGWVGTRTVTGPRTAVFWSTTLIALAIPYTWVALLRGFVDIGAAAMIALAIALYVGDPRLGRAWRPLAIGAVLAAAVLFRRPFAYDAVAVVGVIGLTVVGRAIIAARSEGRAALRQLGGDVLRLVLIAVGGIVVLVGLGHRMVGRLILTDYGALYESYVRDAASVVGWLGSGFGWLIVALAVVGFVVGYRATRSEGLAFIAAFGAVLSAIWVVVVGQQDVHYAAHFVLPVVIGLAALAWTLWQSAPGFGRVAVAGLGALLAVNLAAGLTNIVPGAGSAPRTLLATANAPLVRQDLDEMARLVADLRSMAGTTSPVLVIGSTDGFSDDTVVIADDVNRGDAEPLFVLTSPHVDSRDTYPLNVLLAADVVVVPDPLPLPLAPDKQGVQRVLHDLFVEGDPAVAAFAEVPGSYVLEDGTTVRLLQRTRPTTLDEATAALRAMRDYTATTPGDQVRWASVGGLPRPLEDRTGEVPPIIEAGRDEDGTWVANSLIFIDADASTVIDGSAEFLDLTCAGVDVTVRSINGALEGGPERTFELAPAGPTTFRIEGLGDGAGDLVVVLDQLDPAQPCPAVVTVVDQADDRAGARSLLTGGE